MTTKSVFAKYEAKAYPYNFAGTLHIGTLAGGTPTSQKVAESWLKTKFSDSDDLIREKAAEIMAERGIGLDEATSAVVEQSHLNGFKRDPERDGELYIEGRQLKAALKEAASVAVAAGKLSGRGWGATNKGLLSYVAEHIFVLEDRLHLGVTQPSGVAQRFVHTWRGNGIQYEEYCEDVKVDFTIATDHDFTAEQWAMIWLTGEQQGIGATRSQGYGRYKVVRWEKVS